MNPEELTDYIFNELLSVSKLYQDDKSLEKVNTLNIHLNDSGTIVKSALSTFLSKVKGIIRHADSAYLEVEGPFYVKQTCFLSNTEHDHLLVVVITKYDPHVAK
jgi:hypothetical protein